MGPSEAAQGKEGGRQPCPHLRLGSGCRGAPPCSTTARGTSIAPAPCASSASSLAASRSGGPPAACAERAAVPVVPGKGPVALEARGRRDTRARQKRSGRLQPVNGESVVTCLGQGSGGWRCSGAVISCTSCSSPQGRQYEAHPAAIWGGMAGLLVSEAVSSPP